MYITLKARRARMNRRIKAQRDSIVPEATEIDGMQQDSFPLEMEKGPFRFLDLPADIRNIIYYYALPNHDVRPKPTPVLQILPNLPIPPAPPPKSVIGHLPRSRASPEANYTTGFQEQALLKKQPIEPLKARPIKQPPIRFLNLLLTNHQIFYEASYILCRNRSFTTTLDWDRIAFPSIGNFPISLHDPPQIFASKLSLANLIQTLVIEINWRISYHIPETRIPKQNLAAILIAIEDISGLRELIIEWRDSLDGLLPVARAEWCWEMLGAVYELATKKPECKIMVETPLVAQAMNWRFNQWVEPGKLAARLRSGGLGKWVELGTAEGERLKKFLVK